MTDDPNDPLPRMMEGEPHFVLLARDITAAEMVTLWAALRKRDGSMVDAIVKRLKKLMMELPYQPQKDNKHFWSASQVATDMLVWQKEQEHIAKTGLTEGTQICP